MGKNQTALITLLRKISQVFFGLAIIVYGIQQFIYGNFRNVQLPPWQYNLPGLIIIAYLTGVLMLTGGLAIIFTKSGKQASLIIGITFFSFCLFFHVPYELFSDPNKIYHLGLWDSTLKELALAGGAFVVAQSFHETPLPKILSNKYMKSLASLGTIFFCTTMIAFGIAHFLYIQYVQVMVPAWIPDHIFWAYFGGVALIAAGVSIALDIQKKKVALLLGLMLLLWFVMLHVPGAIANPSINRGNLVASAFDALAFSATAFLIALNSKISPA